MSKIKIDRFEDAWEIGSIAKDFDRKAKEGEQALLERERRFRTGDLSSDELLREDMMLRALGVEVKRAQRKDELSMADVAMIERRVEQLKHGVSLKESGMISESISLSEGSIIPGSKGEKTYRAWWPLLKEGPGNVVSKNYYSRKALDSVVPLVKQRNKMFYGHMEGEVRPTERNVKDWAASIHETKIENGVLSGLVQAYDPWLKDRMYDAPAELACSIEGRGKPGGVIDYRGEKWNLVEAVSMLNHFAIVDYAGNAPMGVTLQEAEKAIALYESWTGGKIDDRTFLSEIEKIL